jgi:diadenosine tetraphosphate (Ap4A) HIT family hydrolase
VTRDSCPFCSPDPSQIFYRDNLAIGLWDRYAVAPGRAPVIPIRHVPTWFETHKSKD